jgi:hypothetical protein
MKSVPECPPAHLQAMAPGSMVGVVDAPGAGEARPRPRSGPVCTGPSARPGPPRPLLKHNMIICIYEW